jgi:antitoxin ParD1/3/4
MVTRNINLTVEQNAFVEKVVSAGRYQNASEAVRDAIRAMQLRIQTEDLQLEALRARIKLGIDALEAGDYIDIDDSDLEAALDRIADDPSL